MEGCIEKTGVHLTGGLLMDTSLVADTVNSGCLYIELWQSV